MWRFSGRKFHCFPRKTGPSLCGHQTILDQPQRSEFREPSEDWKCGHCKKLVDKPQIIP